MAKKTEESIALRDMKTVVNYATVFIEGDGDLVLNCMNAMTTRKMANPKDPKLETMPDNRWENLITSIHWRDGHGMKDTYLESTEEVYENLLKNNAPCITAFGLKKSFCSAVVQNKISLYSTSFNASVNVIAQNGLIPITYASHVLDERIMSPKKGHPVSVTLHHFSGWTAKFVINYLETVYPIDQICEIINMAGFGLGIGSGRTSGYGRYHIVGVTSE